MSGERAARVVWLMIGAIAAVCVQAACGGWLEVRGVRPDVVLVTVMGIGLLAGRRIGVVAGCAAGWCVVTLTPQHPWVWVACYSVAGCAAGWLGSRVYHEQLGWHLLCVFVGAVIVGGVACVLGAPDDRLVPAWSTIIRWWLPSSCYSTLVAPLVFLGVKRLWSR